MFSIQQRVYYQHTDAGGVVYHGKYIDFCEQARTEYLRSKGANQTNIKKEQGIVFAVKTIKCDYKLPAKLDDLLIVTVESVDNNGLIVQIFQKVLLEEKVLFEMVIDLVCVSDSGKPVRIPKNIKDMLA